MIVRFGTPRYEVKGKGSSGKRKPNVFSEKSRDSRMKGGAKVMIAFRGMKGKRKVGSKAGRKGKGKKRGKEGGCAFSC